MSDPARATPNRITPADVIAQPATIQLYRMHDAPGADKAAIPCTRDEAHHYNTPELGFGIFLTVNAFNGPRRKANLVRVQAVAVDMDAGSQHEQAERLRRSPLVPTSIVETKRGFQAYWRVHDVQPEHWNAIVLERLVPYFGADKNARDVCRILRAPGYLHLKDPATPFLCEVVFRSIATYYAAQLLEAFPHVAPRPASAARPARTETPQTGSIWDAIYNLDCERGLELLSGRSEVGGEHYTFRRAPRGHLNIFVDGKGTSCFLDENRRIGSMSKGGPTLYSWLRWHGNSPSVAMRVLKEAFPQLAEIDRKGRTQ